MKLLVLIFFISCGKGEHKSPYCRPQDIAIAECQTEEWQKNPNSFSLNFQKQYCERLYPYRICYAY